MWTAGIHLDQRMNMTLNQPILINKLSIPKQFEPQGKTPTAWLNGLVRLAT